MQLTASLERNEASNFRESLAWLEGGGLVRAPGGRRRRPVLHVPPEKRVNLDFYKNNTIHFFLLPALLTRALARGVAAADLRANVAWWLDLYRWEFPLPERDGLGAEIERWLAHYRAAGALTDDGLDATHPIVRATEGVLENFREGYLVAARAVAAQQEWPIAEKALIDRMRRQFATSRLLGEVTKGEGSSVLVFANALSRLTELGHVDGRAPRPRRA